jgi:hypothetical protein
MKIFSSAARCVLASAAMVIAAQGQTKVDLRTQGRDVDFSAAGSTRPSKTGTVLPGSCATGETLLKTDAEAGKNLYVCTSTNVWTVQGVEMPDPASHANQVLTTDGAAFSWAAFAGDLSGRPGAAVVTGLNGRRLGNLTPLDGQYLRWNGVASQWEPVSLAAAFSVFGRSGAVTAQTGDYTFAQISGSVAAGQLPSAGGDLNGGLTSARVTGLQNRPVGSSVPLSGQALVWDGSQWTPQTVASGVAGGDLSGSLANAAVIRLQSRAISATAPTMGQVLGWDGAQWIPQTVSGGSYANAVDRTLATTYLAGAKQTFVAGVATGGIGVTPSSLPLVPAAGELAVDS